MKKQLLILAAVLGLTSALYTLAQTPIPGAGGASAAGAQTDLSNIGTIVHDLLFTDATYDIGKSGATRPRDGFFSRNVTVSGALTLSSGSPTYLGARSGFSSPADGKFLLTANSGTGFTAFQFGGTTSVYPSLKVFGDALAIRAADDTVPIFTTLTACAAGGEGAVMPVSDSNTNVWGANVAGGGANHVLAYCNGTAWTVAAT